MYTSARHTRTLIMQRSAKSTYNNILQHTHTHNASYILGQDASRLWPKASREGTPGKTQCATVAATERQRRKENGLQSCVQGRHLKVKIKSRILERATRQGQHTTNNTPPTTTLPSPLFFVAHTLAYYTHVHLSCAD